MYGAWRENGGPTSYPSNKTAVSADILLAGFIFASAILGFTFIVALFGYKGKKIVWNGVITMGDLLVLTSIMLCNFGQEWEVASVFNTTMQYKAGIREEINGEIGVSIGLRSVNITLKTDPTVVQFSDGKINETIDYNERFSWNDLGFAQGRGGFGPNAGLINREYREAQYKGVPYPILWVAEYFTIDGEGIRWGRFYRQAGYYTHIMLWMSFPLWIVTIVFFSVIPRYGGYLSMLTGVILGIGNTIYGMVRNPTDLSIPINGEHILTFQWGWCFWLNFVTAFVTFIIGVTVVIVDYTCYPQIARWLGLDLLNETKEVYTEIPSDKETESKESIDNKSNTDNSGATLRPTMSARVGTKLTFVTEKSKLGSLSRQNTISPAHIVQDDGLGPVDTIIDLDEPYPRTNGTKGSNVLQVAPMHGPTTLNTVATGHNLMPVITITPACD